jgi:hypothetical protein
VVAWFVFLEEGVLETGGIQVRTYLAGLSGG